jgi:hypothetical protein
MAPYCVHEICACTTDDNALDSVERIARWNKAHSRRWNHLLTRLRRDHPSLQFMRCIEVQERGVLHDHAIVWSETPLSISRIRSLAIATSFGHGVDLKPLPPGSKAATDYATKSVAGYVTKSCDAREKVPWWGTVHPVDLRTGEVDPQGIVEGRYRTWSCSREWGLTMAQVRREARAFAERMHEASDENLLAALHIELGALPIDESPPAPS